MAKSDVKDPYEPIPQVDISMVSDVISASAVALVSIDNEGVELETYRAVCSASWVKANHRYIARTCTPDAFGPRIGPR